MKKIALLLLFSLGSEGVAADCLNLYKKEADEIQKKHGHTKRVGGQVYQNPHSGELGYWRGVKVQARIDNWAKDFMGAISSGPSMVYHTAIDPKEKWLKAFRRAIKDECSLPKNDYKILRGMLRELMDDGSFCPEGKIIPYRFPGGKGPFKKVLKEAIKGGRFSSLCKNEAIADDSFRMIKDVEMRPSEKLDDKKSSEQ